MVNCQLPCGQDDVGGFFTLWHDWVGRRQKGEEALSDLICIMDSLMDR
jgi:hypothetical protein